LLEFEWIPKYNLGGDRFFVKKMLKIAKNRYFSAISRKTEVIFEKNASRGPEFIGHTGYVII
jgi:hypothetical protein